MRESKKAEILFDKIKNQWSGTAAQRQCWESQTFTKPSKLFKEGDTFQIGTSRSSSGLQAAFSELIPLNNTTHFVTDRFY